MAAHANPVPKIRTVAGSGMGTVDGEFSELCEVAAVVDSDLFPTPAVPSAPASLTTYPIARANNSIGKTSRRRNGARSLLFVDTELFIFYNSVWLGDPP